MSLDISQFPVLAQANTPNELRQLPQALLPQVADELRSFYLSLLACPADISPLGLAR